MLIRICEKGDPTPYNIMFGPDKCGYHTLELKTCNKCGYRTPKPSTLRT